MPTLNPLPAFVRLLGRLLGVHGRATVRDTYLVESFDEFCDDVEAAVRGGWSADQGFAVRVDRQKGTYFHNAYRGWSAGFVVGLVAETVDGGDRVLMWVSRTSKADRVLIYVATACTLVTLVAVPVFIGKRGWILPGIVTTAITVGLCVVVALVILRGLAPLVAAIEYVGTRRVSDEELAEVAERVRAAAGKHLVAAEPTHADG
jgi:hypothetical protein